MKNLTKQTKKEVRLIISKHRLVADREDELIKKGYTTKECPMGSGGTG